MAEKYTVDNITFCSEADLYPSQHEKSRLMLNHLPASGRVEVMSDGKVKIGLDVVAGSSLTSLVETSAFRPINPLCADLMRMGEWASLRLEVEGNEARTYGHMQPARKTFVLRIPNGPGNEALYKIHTTRILD